MTIKQNQRRPIDPSKVTCLSFILSPVHLPLQQWHFTETLLVKGRVMPHSLVHLFQVHSSFPKQYTTLSLSVFRSGYSLGQKCWNKSTLLRKIEIRLLILPFQCCKVCLQSCQMCCLLIFFNIDWGEREDSNSCDDLG